MKLREIIISFRYWIYHTEDESSDMEYGVGLDSE